MQKLMFKTSVKFTNNIKLFVMFFLFFLLNSCLVTEIIDVPITEEEAEETIEKTKNTDTTIIVPIDTTRIPISFDVSVKDWNNQ